MLSTFKEVVLNGEWAVTVWTRSVYVEAALGYAERRDELSALHHLGKGTTDTD